MFTSHWITPQPELMSNNLNHEIWIAFVFMLGVALGAAVLICIFVPAP
jgi:hypothetical protein